MDKIVIKKNILDLAYKRYLQLANAVLFVGGGSIVASFTGLILNPNKSFQYSAILFIVVFFSYYFYNFVSDKLKGISRQITNLK